jgi:hypothetical protein
MKYNQYTFQATVWRYPGMAGWHFVSVPSDISVHIKQNFADRIRGWGSLSIIAKVGKTSWKTSIFPDKETGTYLLPLKAEVRKQEVIIADDSIAITLEITV